MMYNVCVQHIYWSRRQTIKDGGVWMANIKLKEMEKNEREWERALLSWKASVLVVLLHVVSASSYSAHIAMPCKSQERTKASRNKKCILMQP